MKEQPATASATLSSSVVRTFACLCVAVLDCMAAGGLHLLFSLLPLIASPFSLSLSLSLSSCFLLSLQLLPDYPSPSRFVSIACVRGERREKREAAAECRSEGNMIVYEGKNERERERE